MGKMITCTSVGAYSEALARGQQYEVLEEDNSKVKIRGNNGRTRWYPKVCFDLEGGPAPTLTTWKFDEHIENVLDDWVDVSFELSDGTSRWCSCVTPTRLHHSLAIPHSIPGVWSANLIVVRTLTFEDVDMVLKYLDQQGDLIAASLPLNSITEHDNADEEPDE